MAFNPSLPNTPFCVAYGDGWIMNLVLECRPQFRLVDKVRASRPMDKEMAFSLCSSIATATSKTVWKQGVVVGRIVGGVGEEQGGGGEVDGAGQGHDQEDQEDQKDEGEEGAAE